MLAHLKMCQKAQTSQCISRIYAQKLLAKETWECKHIQFKGHLNLNVKRSTAQKQDELSANTIDNDVKSCFKPMKMTFVTCLVRLLFEVCSSSQKCDHICWDRLTKYICYCSKWAISLIILTKTPMLLDLRN